MSTMDIRGLILINTTHATHEELPFPRPPVAMIEVAGMSPLERVAERLRRHGVSPVTVIVEENSSSRRGMPSLQGVVCRTSAPDRFWNLAESTFNDLAQDGAELVLVIRLGAYAEIDFERLVQFHLEAPRRVSQAVRGAEPLEVFCLTASRRNDAASLFRSRLTRCRSQCAPCAQRGYVNPLAAPRDLRQFAIDLLTLKTETLPAGTEVRPGIWIASGASIERDARIVAPAFVGPSAKVRCGVVVTRCSTVEHHAQVDCGTVVENSSVLPYSYVGAGLDVAHSVVGMGFIANLRRGATVQVSDQKLVGQVSAVRRQRLWTAAAGLPSRIWRRIFGEAQPPRPPLEDALLRPSSALGVSACDPGAAGGFAPNLAVARKYGNH